MTQFNATAAVGPNQRPSSARLSLKIANNESGRPTIQYENKVTNLTLSTSPKPEIQPLETPYMQSKNTKITMTHQASLITYLTDSSFVYTSCIWFWSKNTMTIEKTDQIKDTVMQRQQLFWALQVYPLPMYLPIIKLVADLQVINKL